MSELPFGELQDLALLIFYKSAKNDLRIPGRNTRRFRVYRMTGQKEFFVERAVDGLADKKLIEESKEAYSRPYITAKGIEYFERQLSRKGSTIEKYYGTSALKIYAEDVPSTNRVFPEITGRDVIFLEFIPASDRAVTLDHNSKDYKDAATALDKLATELDQANDLGDLTAAEKTYAQEIIQSGRKLLSATSIRVAAATLALLPMLNWLGMKLAEKTVGELAVAAAKAIIHLLGLS